MAEQLKNDCKGEIGVERTITVKGMGSASAKPNLVQLTLALEARNMLYERAMDDAAGQLKSVADSLAHCGIRKEDIRTTSFSVDTAYRQEKDARGVSKRVFDGFQCAHRLSISFDLDMQRLAQVLSALSGCAAEPEFSIRFTVRDTGVLKDEALTAAAKDARAKAQVLARASGIRLGDLLRVDYSWGEISIFSGTEYSSPTGMAACDRSIEIEPEDVCLNDTVTFVWEIC